MNSQDQQRQEAAIAKYTSEECKSKKVQTKVSDPTKSGVIMYMIKCDDYDGIYETQRRYSDFSSIRQVLVEKWPGCYVPPVPSKKIFFSKDKNYVEMRKRFLDFFLIKISELPHLHYSEEMRTFYDKDRKERDLELLYAKRQPANLGDIINRYKGWFSHLSDNSIGDSLYDKIKKFKVFIGNCEVRLNTIRQTANACVMTQFNYNIQHNYLFEDVMPNYEKTLGVEYFPTKNGNMVFSRHSDEVQKAQEEFKNQTQQSHNYDMVVDLIRIEQKELLAMQQTLLAADEFEVRKTEQKKIYDEQEIKLIKLKQGGNVIVNAFSRRTPEEKIPGLEQSQAELKEEIDNLNLLCSIITIVLGHQEIDKFKSDKISKYYYMLQKLSLLEQEYNKQVFMLWSNVRDYSDDLYNGNIITENKETKAETQVMD